MMGWFKDKKIGCQNCSSEAYVIYCEQHYEEKVYETINNRRAALWLLRNQEYNKLSFDLKDDVLYIEGKPFYTLKNTLDEILDRLCNPCLKMSRDSNDNEIREAYEKYDKKIREEAMENLFKKEVKKIKGSKK